MGFGSQAMRLIADANWSANRKELAPVVEDALDRCRLLNRAGRLSTDQVGRVASWNVDLLRAMASAPSLPGTPDESIALRSMIAEALVLAIEAEPSPRQVRSNAARGSTTDASSGTLEEMIQWFENAEDGENNIATIEGSAYIQWGMRYPKVRVEVSSGPELGGDAMLSTSQVERLLKMGWNRPRPGIDDYPNYWQEWDWEGSRYSGLDTPTAWLVVHEIARTLRLVFDVEP